MSAKVNHILFPTDFSEAAESAFKYCLNFASKVGAKVSVLHIYALPIIQDITLPESLQNVYDEIYQEEFKKFSERIPQLEGVADELGIRNVPMDFILKEGHDIPDVVVKTQHDIAADMIVVGTQGASLIEKYFLGNNTSNIMEYSNVPVLGVPPKAVLPAELEAIVMCTDYSDDDKKILHKLKELFPAVEENIISLHVDVINSEKPVDHAEQWAAFAQAENIAHEVIRAASFVQGIQAYDDYEGIDILVMRTHERNVIFNVFNRYTAKKIIYSKTVPLLALPEKYWSQI